MVFLSELSSMHVIDVYNNNKLMVKEQHLVVDSDNSTCVYISLPRLGLLRITADLYGVFNNTFETLIVSSHCKTDTIIVATKECQMTSDQCQTYMACYRKKISFVNEDKCIFICQCNTACDNIFIQVQHHGLLDIEICEIIAMLS